MDPRAVVTLNVISSSDVVDVDRLDVFDDTWVSNDVAARGMVVFNAVCL